MSACEETVSYPTKQRFVRLAVDIGSGCTKVCGAVCVVIADTDQDGTTVHIEKILLEKEVLLLIGQAVRRDSIDGNTIPEAVVQQLHECLATLNAELRVAIRAYNETVGGETSLLLVDAENFTISGIATAIFRSASNGPEVLASLLASPKLRLRCSVLSQDSEAAIGYETARQLMLTSSSINEEDKREARLVSYDSGAASFQLATIDAEACSSGGGRRSLTCFNGQWGNTTAHLALLRMKEERAGENTREKIITSHNELDPNPVGPDLAAAFVNFLLADLGNSDRHSALAAEYFKSLFTQSGEQRTIVQCFGGDTCAFMMASHVLGGATLIQRDELWAAISHTYAHLTFDEIKARGFEHPEVLLPKLLLVYSVMTFLGIREVYFERAIGNTRALVCMSEFWQ